MIKTFILSFRGTTTGGDKVFREAFRKINELRSFCRPNVPILAMTATADADYSSLISGSCCLSNNVSVIAAASDRKNICLSVFKTVKGPEKFESLSWIVEGLKEDGLLFPKTILYCRTVKLVGEVFNFLMLKLGNAAYLEDNQSSKSRLIGMFHSETIESKKLLVLESLTSSKGCVRLIIATSSLGCGVDCKDVVFVVHLGVPFDMADYVQQIGRAGRGQNVAQCHAILYATSSHGRSHINKNILEYSKSSSCLRSLLFTPFNENNEKVLPLSPPHICCSNCKIRCTCFGGNRCRISYPFEVEVAEAVPREEVRDVSIAYVALVKSLLADYSSAVCKSATRLFTPPAAVSGLSSAVTDQIVANLPYISSIQDIFGW